MERYFSLLVLDPFLQPQGGFFYSKAVYHNIGLSVTCMSGLPVLVLFLREDGFISNSNYACAPRKLQIYHYDFDSPIVILIYSVYISDTIFVRFIQFFIIYINSMLLINFFVNY